MQVLTNEGEALIGERGSIIQEGSIIPGVVTEPTTYVDIGVRRISVDDLRTGEASAFVHDPETPQPRLTPEQAGQMIFPASQQTHVSPGQWQALSEETRQRYRDTGVGLLGGAGMTIVESSGQPGVAGYRRFNPDTDRWPGQDDQVIVTGADGEQIRGVVEMRSNQMTIGLRGQQLSEDTALTIRTADERRIEITGEQLRGGEVRLHTASTGAEAIAAQQVQPGEVTGAEQENPQDQVQEAAEPGATQGPAPESETEPQLRSESQVETEIRHGNTVAAEKTGVPVSYGDIDPIELPSGTVTRIEANITALETANLLRDENRYATPHELRLLAGYTGWGGLGDVFDPAEERFHDAHEQLKVLISDQAYHTLRSSILNAHYTPPELAEAIWEPVREAAAGRESLRVLEPGSGTGHFFRASGMAGADTDHQFVGVEMDETTARISALLHPEAEVHHAGYEDTRFAEDSFDLAIGNVPFGSFSLPDPVHNTAGLSIHNHFIYKSLAQTAPGGYVAVISSRFTMDAKAETARRAMARHGDLVGAVRLPEGAQSSVSGTVVGTDVLIFRKREHGTAPDPETLRWITTTPRTVTDRDGVPHHVEYNTYFDEHPENVLGSIEHDSNPFGPGYRVSGARGEELADQVRTRITALTTQTDLEFAPQRTSTPTFAPGIQTPPEPEARFGEVRHNSTADQFEEYTSTLTWQRLKNHPNKTKRAKEEALALIGIRDTARQVVSAQRDGTSTEDRERLRQDLRHAWESYHDTYGPINRRTAVYRTPAPSAQQAAVMEMARQWVAETRPETDSEALSAETLESIASGQHESVIPDQQLRTQWAEAAKAKVFHRWKQDHLAPFSNDPSLGLIQAVENLDHTTGEATPAAMLTRDIVAPTATATRAQTPQEAVGISMAERGHVDTSRIAELLGVELQEVDQYLEGLVFTDPVSGRVEASATYLSGNVRQKLDQARAAAETEPEYAANVAALEGVQPETIELDEITINPGVPWLEKELYEQFAHDTFGVPVEVTYNPHAESGKWHITTPQAKPGEDVLYQWGTAHRNVKPWDVLEKTLNSQVFSLTKPDPGDPSGKKRLPDPQASDAANDKAAQLKERFRTWISEDPQRAQQVQQAYNRLFNSMVPADYSAMADQLTFPGLAEDRKPYTYQRKAVARALNEPAALLDHVVGAGKTGSMIMTAMEKRRLGHANKPALVVPNHLVTQISTEWKQWYPTAEVMTIPAGLKPAERRELFARAAAGQWDAVILSESVFDEVSIDPVRHQAMMESDIAQMRNNVATLRAGGASKQAIKKAESDVKSVEKRYHGLQNKSDVGLVFEETGIDFLMVDEAHHFKNLRRSSDVPELDGGIGSKRAENLNYILRAMREDRIDRAKAEGTYTEGYVPSVALFSTGTPVANKVSEMWVMQSYLRPDLLAERGISDVTAWGDTFTEQDWRVIATPDGRYQRSLKVTGFANVPELLAFNRSFQDSVTRADLEVPLPQVVSGERQLHVLEPSQEVEEFVADLQKRVDRIKQGGVDPREDNVLKIVHEGRMAALDPRLMDLETPLDGGRAAAVAEQITRIHGQTQARQYLNEAGEVSPAPGGLQIVFADMSTPKPGEPETFTIYQGLKNELVSQGMDESRIAFIHDAGTEAERADLFRKARAGEINVLVGSTQKMGTGMNVQDRAVALHHIDPPWRPADIEQREGRIIRQGNQNTEVEIHAYGTAGTTDTFMWSKLSQKAGFIEQLKNPTGIGRTMEDPLGGIDATAANAQAVLSGDERIGELLELESEITTLERLEHTHLAAQARARGQVREHQRAADTYEQQLPGLRELANEVTDTRGHAFSFTTAEGTRFTSREEAGNHLAGHVRRAAFIAEQDSLQPSRPVSVGTLGGVELNVYRHLSNVHLATRVPGHDKAIRAESIQAGNVSASGLSRTAENLVSSTPEKVDKWQQSLERHRKAAEDLISSAAAGWDRGEDLEAKRTQYAKLRAELQLDEDTGNDEQVTGKITGEVITHLGVSDPDKVSSIEIRDGDTVRLTGGPSGDDSAATGYYTIKTAQVPDTRHYAKEGATREGLIAWKEGEEESSAEPVDSMMFINDKVKLVARDAASLSEIEKYLVSTFEEPTARKVPSFSLKEGMRITVAEEDTGTPVSGIVTAQQAEPHSRYGPKMVHIDGEDAPEPLGGEGSRLSASMIVQTNYTPPERRTGTGIGEGPSPVRELSYGCLLTEDIDEVGKAGDILITRSSKMRFAEPYSLNPATGVATKISSPWTKLESNQFSAPVMLSKAERAKLGAESEDVFVTTARTGLRAGDQVVWRDIDKMATTGQPVTLTHVHHAGYKDKTSVEYEHPTKGSREPAELGNKSEIRVLNRARAALTTEELVRLAVRPSGSLPRGIDAAMETTSVTADQLANPHEHFGTDTVEVVLNLRNLTDSDSDNNDWQVLTGTLCDGRITEAGKFKATLVTAESQQEISVEPSELSAIIPPHPLEVSDLNIGGHEEAESGATTEKDSNTDTTVQQNERRKLQVDPDNADAPFSWENDPISPQRVAVQTQPAPAPASAPGLN